ncbi:MAG: Rpn family recombination-promoting nuclease/putative transposase [Bacteroidales bacterium]|nr:Rpn family recombination-promoting nuclease/putative transposase [Bacteroidales bacterium]
MTKRTVPANKPQAEKYINPLTDFGFKRIFGTEANIDRDTHRVFYDKLTFVFMELPLFTKPVDGLQNDFDRWLYVLKHLSELQDFPEPLRNRVFHKLFHIAEITQMSPGERDSYDQSLKEYRDMYLMETALKKKDAIIRKQDARLRNSARILLEASIDMQQISESTGLSIAEIEKIGKG